MSCDAVSRRASTRKLFLFPTRGRRNSECLRKLKKDFKAHNALIRIDKLCFRESLCTKWRAATLDDIAQRPVFSAQIETL
jgi:hypothetical protein